MHVIHSVETRKEGRKREKGRKKGRRTREKGGKKEKLDSDERGVSNTCTKFRDT